MFVPVPIPPEILQRLVILLLFRLGGQQTFEPGEIKDIQDIVGCITMYIDKDQRVILKTQSMDQIKRITKTENE